MRGRVALVAVVAVAAGLSTLPARSAVRAAPRPNFVVIMTDDQTVESLRVMPYVQALLVDQGVLFERSFSSFPLCCPSRSTYLTGQYSHNHEVHGNTPPYGGYASLDHTNTLPVWLDDAGYRTTHVGKYLNGYGNTNPNEVPPGWDDWQGLVDPTTYRMYNYTINDNGTLVDYGTGPANYQTDVLRNRALTSIDESVAAGAPFLVSVAPLAPHAESAFSIPGPRAAPRHEGRFASEPLPRPPSFNEAAIGDKPRPIRNLPLLTPANIATITTAYRDRLESLLAVDEMVAAVVGRLSAAGVLANTYIVFTSDNGFFHGEHRIKNGKVKLYEESARVPLVIRGAGFAPGTRAQFLAVNPDLATTIVRLAGVTPGRSLDGRSLRYLLQNPGVADDRAVLLENFDPVSVATTGYTDAIRTERYVYVEWTHSDGVRDRELYDLAIDPYQLVNRAGRDAYASVQSSLRTKLGALKNCAGATCHVRFP
jgi:arylsulfatase A-like enzyme